MSTENIDVVINPGSGGRRVVRDLNDIANAADNAAARLQRLQQQINSLGTNNGLNQFQQQLTAVTTQLQALNAQLQQMHGGINRIGGAAGGAAGFGALRGAITGLMGVLSVKQIMDWADAWISAEGKIRSLAPTMADAQIVLEKLFEVAQKTRAPLDKLVSVFHFMTISSKDLGASQQEMIRVTESVAKVLAVQGTSFQQAKGALLQLAQAFGTNRVRGQEFNSMLQNAPLLLQVAARHIEGANGSVAKLRQMMLEGKLTSKAFFEGILAGSEEIDKMFTQAPKTFAQGFTVLKNAIEKYLGDLNNATEGSKFFYEIMERLAGSIDNVARSLALVGIVLLSLPLGPIGVAIASAAGYMALFGEKTLVAKDGVTTLSDVTAVVWDDMRSGMVKVQDAIVEFRQKYLPELGKGFADLGNITFMDLIKAADQMFDKILQAAVGGAYGIAEAFRGLPVVIDEVGKRMFNSLVSWIEAAINKIIEGLNKVGKLIGDTAIPLLNFEKAKVDEYAFRNYGQKVSEAVAAGVKAAGNPFEKSFNSMMDRAMVRGIERAQDLFRKSEIIQQNANLNARGSGDGTGKTDKGALSQTAKNERQALNEIFDLYREKQQQLVELERHKEVMLKASYDQGAINYKQYMDTLAEMQDTSFANQKQLLNETLPQLVAQADKVRKALSAKGVQPQELQNFTQDFTTKINQLADALDKLNNKQEETLAARATERIRNMNQFLQQAEKAIALNDVNLAQEMDKIAAKKNMNQLDEKGLYIQQEMLRLMGPYQDALARVQEQLKAAADNGLFQVDDENIQRTLINLIALAEKLKGRIDEIAKKAPQTLGAAFDAGQMAALSKKLSSGVADALVDGGRNAAPQIRKILDEELRRKPLKVLIEAILKPISDAISTAVVSVTNSLVSTVTNGSVQGGLSGVFSGLINGGKGLGGDFFSQLIGSGGGNSTLSMIGSGLGYAGALYSASQGKWGTAIGTGVGTWFGGPVGAMIGGAIGSFADSLFGGGGGRKEGAYVGAATANPSGMGIGGSGGEYNAGIASNLQQRISALGTQYNTLLRAFGGNMSMAGATFGMGISTDPKGTSATFAETTARNAQGQVVYSYANTHVGRSEEALNAELNMRATEALMYALNNAGVKGEFIDYFNRKGWGQSAEVQEKVLQTMMAVSELNKVIDSMGASAGNLALMSMDAKVALMDLAGGLENLTAGMQAYYNNFFSAEEQRAAMIQNINKRLASVGIAFDAATGTRAQFRAIVESLDMNSAAGQAAYVALMDVAGAFAEITKTGNAAADAANAAAEAQRQYEEKVATAKSNLQQAYDRERGALEQVIQGTEQWRDTLVNFRAGLKTSSNSPYTPQQRYQNSIAEYNRVLTDMMSNDPNKRNTANAQFQQVAQAFLEASRLYNASGEQYQTDYARVLQDTDKALQINNDTYNTAVSQLQRLDTMVGSLIDINTSVMSVDEAVRQLVALTGQAPAGGMPATAAQQAAMNNVGSSWNSNFSSLWNSAPPGVGLYGVGSSQEYQNMIMQGMSEKDARAQMVYSPGYMTYKGLGPAITELYQIYAGRAPTTEEFNWAYAAYGNRSLTLQSLGQALGGHAGGLDFVPRNNYVFRAHYGEAVLNAGQATAWRAAQAGGMDLSPLLQCINQLRAEIAELREQHASGVQADLAAQRQAARDNADRIGQYMSENKKEEAFRLQQRSKATTQ